MQCKNHPESVSAARCSGCQESFCANCLVEVKGLRYCGSCKIMAIEGKDAPLVENLHTVECPEAKEALKYAIIGLFCFGIILGPMAISKANAAKQLIKADPTLSGAGKATAAQIIGFTALAFWLIGIISKFAKNN